MSVNLPSDEVAEDYKNSLEDLVSNDRYQISNLTLIAKENIEHAEAISRVLQNHILRVPPARKLPALYVLDSIVKNVGSPYTVYFGRNLYQTFMHAYSQVDGNVKRKLEEMLKTWREPVPGALSTVPVFPLTSTQAIIDNLKKLRSTGTVPTQRYQSTIRPASTKPFLNTSTPPQLYGQTELNIQNHPPVTSTPLPLTNSVNIEKLHLDIDDLTTDAKIECATHPMDGNAQRKLATFQSLKEILDSGNASELDLIDIRNSIMQEMAKKLAIKNQTSEIPSGSIPPVQNNPPNPKFQTSSTSSLLNSINLAELLRATSNTNQIPISYTHTPFITNTPPIVHATPISQTIGEMPLLAQLRASGLLSSTTPTATATSISSGVKTPNLTFPINMIETEFAEIKITSSSIRIPRPQLITKFLNLRPNQCTTCGRRFNADDIGREKKARHLDWHFKTKARMIEAEQRGQNRSWYIGEREWINSREYEDDPSPFDLNGLSNIGTSPANQKKKIQNFVRAPTDPILRSLPCPIDQEPFRSEWNEEVQDFIWKDTIQVGGRYYHASCYDEVMKTRITGNDTITQSISSAERIATPDSILGKRKAEDENSRTRSKIKLEGD